MNIDVWAKKICIKRTRFVHSFFFFSFIRNIYHGDSSFFPLYQYFNLNFLSMCHIYFDCTPTNERTNEPTHTHTSNQNMVATEKCECIEFHTQYTHTRAFYTLKWNLLSLWFILPSCIFMYGVFSLSCSLLYFNRFLSLARFLLCYVSHFVLSVSIQLIPLFLLFPFHFTSRSFCLSVCVSVSFSLSFDLVVPTFPLPLSCDTWN